MLEALAHFHLLRPWALWGLIPAVLFLWLLWRSKNSASQWQKHIDPALLPYLLDGHNLRSNQRLLTGLGIIWLLAIIALSGPVWEQRPSPVQRQVDALVLVLDLSPSMVVDDVAPSRMVHARLKLAEILQRRQEGETGLIVYGGDAHVVTPLTSDTDTIVALLPSLGPGIMPLPGSNTEAAIAQATDMLIQAGMGQGRILLVTDGVDPRAEKDIIQTLKNTPYTLSILGIGTADGAPIPSGRGDFIRDGNNQVVISRLDSRYLQTLARQFNGRYHSSHFDGRDLEYLLPDINELTREHRTTEQNIDQWYDRGPWLVLLLLPLLLYSFRRGVLMIWLLPAALVLSPQADALQLQDLWLTPDQQGARALAADDAATAAERFHDPAWKGTAAYQAGDYLAAEQHFSELDTASAHYNRGNALAQQGKLDEAILAYEEALQLDSQLNDAAANRELLEQLREQQQQQEGENGQDGEQNQSGEEQGDSDSSSDDGQSQEDSSQTGDSNSEERDPTQGDDGADKQDAASDNPPPSAPGEEPPAGTDSDEGQSDNEPASDESSAKPDADEPESESPQESQADDAADESDTGDDNQAQSAALTEAQEREQEQALEQWLRQVPDDPAGLLRNKFRHQYQQRTQERIEQKINPFNDNEQRW